MGIENGVFSTHDLARLGVTRAELRGYVERGALIRLRRGWYLRTGAHDPVAAAAVRDRSRWWYRPGLDSRRLPRGTG
ncbi:MAG: type IV toxin-antitoxin system AbiEi family antitoxin domain-containing protein [Gordonia sp. (in: high G+C Gram-positive bacteria)]|uniref:type IV toxin-antitoxin system AbiEi family antitoxin domain-containing protein n=1 Tax=Gordonia sp. (in: high G+C Gram-positive bacteria) TaxID=84139 RepID=UPI0039E52383